MSTLIEIQDFDKKVNLVIGELLNKADAISKSVITVFDPSKDHETNKQLLGGYKFTPDKLDVCANFFNINKISSDGNKLYTSKLSLASRIITEIKALYPAICSECNEEYSVQHGSSMKLRCFICLQGSHDCDKFSEQLPADTPNLPKGNVWLCSSCHLLNNTIHPPGKKAKKAKSLNGKKAVTYATTSDTDTPNVSGDVTTETVADHTSTDLIPPTVSTTDANTHTTNTGDTVAAPAVPPTITSRTPNRTPNKTPNKDHLMVSLV